MFHQQNYGIYGDITDITIENGGKVVVQPPFEYGYLSQVWDVRWLSIKNGAKKVVVQPAKIR